MPEKYKILPPLFSILTDKKTTQTVVVPPSLRGTTSANSNILLIDAHIMGMVSLLPED